MLRNLLTAHALYNAAGSTGEGGGDAGASTSISTAPDGAAELAKLKADLAAAQAEAAGVKQATFAMFDPNKTIADRATAAQKALTAAGFTATAAAEWVANNMAEDPSPEGNQPQPNAGGNAPTAGDRALQMAEETQREVINERFNASLRDAKESSAVQKLLSRVKESRGPESVAKIQAMVEKRLQAESMVSLRELHSRGVKLTAATIEAKVQEALSSVVGELSTVIADAGPLGRGAETGANGSQTSKRQLKDAPKIDFEELDRQGRISDAHSVIESWFKDEMLTLGEMAIAEAGTSKGKSRA